MDDIKLEELEKACKKITRFEPGWSRYAWFACATCPWMRLPIFWCGAPHGSATGCAVTTTEASKASGISPRCGRPRRILLIAEHGLISSHAMDRIPLSSLRLRQAIKMSLTLPEGVFLIMRQIFFLHRKEICLPWKSLPHSESAYGKMPFRCGDCARIKIFRFDVNIQKIQATSDRIFLAVTMHIIEFKSTI